jgi:penicillin amidase
MKVEKRNRTAIFFFCFFVISFGLMILVGGYQFATQPVHSGRLLIQTPSRNAFDQSSLIKLNRDSRGMVHIAASQAADVYWALGFAHAQDRLWQMDFLRRVGQGRLSEILGERALPVDRVMRTLGLYRLAQQQTERFEQIDPDLTQILIDYSAGVNAAIEQSRQSLPLEFALLQTTPAPWQPADSVLMSYLLALDLSGNLDAELTRFEFTSFWQTQANRHEKFHSFFPPYPNEKPLVEIDLAQFYEKNGLNVREKSETVINPSALSFADPTWQSIWRQMPLQTGLGSNNWVVSGALTESGKPLLANDPHLKMTNPQTWYMASLTAQDASLSVVGATLPGVPVVVLGHNASVAWGFTNNGIDAQDTYLEKINWKTEQFVSSTGVQNLSKRQEKIVVKGKADEVLSVFSTRHVIAGKSYELPVISDVLPHAKQALAHWKINDDSLQLAMSLFWTAFVQNDALSAGLGMNRAHDWTSFRQAAMRFDVPSQNIVYADVSGNIAWIAPALYPKRRADHELKGWVPALGWQARFDWDGFQDRARVPEVLNPKKGYWVSANAKVDDANYPFFMTADWALPVRQERITELLKTKIDRSIKLNAADMQAIQMDQQSQMFRRLLPYWKKLDVSSLPVNRLDAKQKLEQIQDWSAMMRADDWRPFLAVLWFEAWSRRVFADELDDAKTAGGAGFYDQYAAPATMFWPLWHVVLEGDLSNKQAKLDWCDDMRTPQHESCSDQMRLSFLDAVDRLKHEENQRGNIKSWGEIHRVYAEHRPFSAVPWLANSVEFSVPVGGDAYSVNVSNYPFRGEHQWRAYQAAGLRAIYDVDQPIRAYFNWPLANSALASRAEQQQRLDEWSKGVFYRPDQAHKRLIVIKK